MSCYIDYCDDGDPCDFYKESLVMSRKEHLCSECGRIIPVGEKRKRIVGKWSGKVYSFDRCIDCDSIRDFICGCEGNLLQEIIDTISDNDEDKLICFLNEITPNAKEFIIDIIDEYWEDC